MTGPLKRRTECVRVLEIGPGTGAVTKRIVQLLKPDDRFDLVELNEEFVDILNRRFESEADFQSAAPRSQIHCCPLQDFSNDAPYDIIISGLPLNNFPQDLVAEIFETYFKLLAPGGVLSYFEYMYVRPVRKLVSRGSEKERIHALDEIMTAYAKKHGFDRSWVFVNVPPAWVQHLQAEPVSV